MAKFTVDTQLFRELGELLVGRESTALVELIKNAYDADARAVVVWGENIDDPVNGQIYIEDNGIGMTLKEFEDGFLRIATRVKSEGDRRSPLFNRRYTGEKGIGRLALHKLARQVEILSYKWDGEKPQGPNLGREEKGIKADIDWDLVEKERTLDDVQDGAALQVTTISPRSPDDRHAGTRVTLSRLRKVWTATDVTRFHRDVATLLPPPALTENPTKNVIGIAPLFASPRVRDIGTGKHDEFNLELLGDLQFAESFGKSAVSAAHWIIEIDSDASRSVTTYQIAPTKLTLSEFPNSESVKFETPIPDDEPHLSFQARIFQKSNDTWDPHFSGVRMYMEGFRILPYGEPTDDWLRLSYDYSRRGKSLLPNLAKNFDDVFAGDEREGVVIQANQAYFGGVFLTHAGAPHLLLLINREGFLPGPELEAIERRVRIGIDMGVRVRHVARSEATSVRRTEKDRQRTAAERADIRETPTAQLTVEEIKETEQSFKEARAAVSSGDMERAKSALAKVQEPWVRFQDFCTRYGGRGIDASCAGVDWHGTGGVHA